MRIGWSVSNGFLDGPEFRVLVVIMSLFLLTGYKLGFHGLMVSTVEKDPLAEG